MHKKIKINLIIKAKTFVPWIIITKWKKAAFKAIIINLKY